MVVLARDDLAETQRPAARNSIATPRAKAEILAAIDAWAKNA